MEKITIGVNSISKEEKQKIIEKIGLSNMWVPENTYFGTKKYKFDTSNGKEEFDVPVFEFLNFAAEVDIMHVSKYVELLERDLRRMLKNTYANVYIGYSIFDTEYEVFIWNDTIVDIIPFVGIAEYVAEQEKLEK